VSATLERMTSQRMTSHRDRAPRAYRPSTVVTCVGALLTFLALVTAPPREALFRAVSETAERSPSSPVVAAVAGHGLLALVALIGAVGLWTILRRRTALPVVVLSCSGVVVAYGLSEGIKMLVREERPCSVVDVATVLACPGQGDWSWPSNHATLAGAAATAAVLTVPRLALLAAPLALLVAGARVAGGVHYVHDVLSGLALGTLVVVLVVAAGRRAGVGRAAGALVDERVARPGT
jgi:undecaprenyl-diphosphatase